MINNNRLIPKIALAVVPVLVSCVTIQKVRDRMSARSAGQGKSHRGDVLRPAANSATLKASPMPKKAMEPPARIAAEVVPVAETCVPMIWKSDADGDVDATLPQSSRSEKYVVTKLFRSCVSRTGQPGIEENSTWLAMGFPCSGGDGRVDWKGTNYQRPKMVEMIIANDCPMGPPDAASLKELAAAEMGIPRSATLGAYTPFMVQFWEIPALRDADTGFTVSLRRNEGLTNTWAKMIKGEPLRVRLIGRENAWTQTDHLYSVDADLTVTSKNRFQLKVVAVKVMTHSEVSEAKSRCAGLRPSRNCSSIF